MCFFVTIQLITFLVSQSTNLVIRTYIQYEQMHESHRSVTCKILDFNAPVWQPSFLTGVIRVLVRVSVEDIMSSMSS